MKSITAILFAAVAALAFTSAAPAPSVLQARATLTTENQQCKEPFQKIYNECVGHGDDVACQRDYFAGNADCDKRYSYSVAAVTGTV
ncbi:hypothetical protein EC991_011167 [Linnemannia zychae]|nr:hypothetical protein EC991_011167 [Linnemannia zychae]